MNITDILMCPECGSGLSGDLKCNGCHNQYEFKNGIFDIISQKLSGFKKTWTMTVTTNDTPNPPLPTRPPVSEEYTENWRQAHQKLNDLMNPLLTTLSGTVCDLATGLGSNLRKLLNAESEDFNIVCIDIDKMILRMLKWNEKSPRISCIAADAHHMSIKDNSFDYITGASAFDNVPESDKTAKEVYRTLKPGGKLINWGTYIDKNSKSFELAQNMELEKGMVEESLIQELENAGFVNIISTIVAEIKAEIQEGTLPPVAGDMQYLYLIQAEKS